MAEARPARWQNAQQQLQQLLSKLGALLLLVGVSIATALLVVADVPEQVPFFGDDSLGHVAPAAVRLNRDYDVLDPDATERSREAAIAEVRPVYDFDSQVQQEVESRVAESFAFARAELVAHPTARNAGGHNHAGATSEDPLRGELTGRLQTSIDLKDFAALAEAGFSAPIEDALAGLVRTELSQLIVEDRELLPAERERGILVRPLPDGAGEVVTELDTLRDLASIRADVERRAEALPGQLTPAVRKAIGHLARGALRANLIYDAAETARRRARAGDSVAPVVLHLARGEQLIGAGERIEPRHLFILKAIHSQARPVDTSRVRVAVGLLAAMVCFLCYRLSRVSFARRPSRKDTLFVGLTVVSTLGLIQAVLGLAAVMRQGVVGLPAPVGTIAGRLSEVDFLGALPYAMPVAAGTILIRLFLGPELTGLFAVAAAVLFGLLRSGSFPLTIFALAAGLVAGRRARVVTRKRSLLRVGAFVASTNVGIILCSALLSGRLFESQTAVELGAGVVGGLLLTPLLVAALAPLFEAAFGYVRDARLAELCNLNHPALKDLIVRAPGTYHHTIVLASLAEAAAEAIGANPLMARTIGLYHDLGKGKAPLMFAENQKSRAELPPGDDLPEVLKRHVADGVEVGRRYRLPRAVIEAIAQHHGTRRVGSAGEGLTTDLRYDGPRPRRRETAIVMLADAVEAQSRRYSLKEVPRLSEYIAEILSRIANEGELDESDLKLGDLPRITAAFSGAIAQSITSRGQEPAAPSPITEWQAPARTITLDLN